MFLGSIMLFEETPGFPFRVDWKIALTVALLSAGFFVFALGMALKIRFAQPTTGAEGLVGKVGVASSTISPQGTIHLGAEIWKALSDEKIKKGERVRIVSVDGLELKVEKINS